ncbi:MAG: 3-deoxy-7-phosphoheptulonate synthase [Pirellulales bacterium]
MQRTSDVNIRSLVPLTPPQALIDAFPLSERTAQTVIEGREAIRRILAGEDRRLLLVVGPCSIHDEAAALDYARRILAVSSRLSDRLCIVMRVYFEKPRTTVGWKGLINDPHLDGTFDIPEGLRRGRKLLLEINEMGMPCATEMLDPVTPQYTADLVTWASIGARTTESQTHRQMASGLSMPVGFKNATDGNLQIAIDAMFSARTPHSFLGIDVAGQLCIVNTTGNSQGHIILRGGRTGTNYDPQTVQDAVAGMAKAGLASNVMVDCSHANSEKDHRKQEGVWHNVLQQRAAGTTNIIGMMLESNLHEGQQKLVDPKQLAYGVSITDACLGWEKTEELLEAAHAAMARAMETAGA